MKLLTNLRSFTTILFGVLLGQVASQITHPDEIRDLPGLHYDINFKQYSGYLEASEGNFLFYWFVESQRSPEYDPLLLWLSGGPGCSSLDGLLGELGAFRVQSDGKTLYDNEFSWNKVANVLFMESPVGVGFSYSTTGNYTTNDDMVSLDNYMALQHFFDKFPQFRTNEFYITGESYAGVYVPTLAVRVLTGNTDINLKGFAIGNGQLDKRKLDQSVMFFYYFHGIIGYRRWDLLVKHCCRGTVSLRNCKFFGRVTKSCGQVSLAIYKYVYSLKINNYNVYDNCFQPPPANKTPKYAFHKFDYQPLFPQATQRQQTHHFNVPCIDTSSLTHYLERGDVRRALHVRDGLPEWEICNAFFMKSYVKLYRNVKSLMLQLVNSGKVRGLVYGGDLDAVCNYLGAEWFVRSLNLPVVQEHRGWRYHNQLAGFVKRYRGLDFLTVKGAGHMVAQYLPGPALKMITSFLYDLPYDAPC